MLISTKKRLILANYLKNNEIELKNKRDSMNQDLKPQRKSIPDELRKDFSKLRKYLVILVDH